MLKRGGSLGIVLPETVFHAPTLGYLRQFLLNGNNVVAVIDLPHNTFRPHCNAKTCLFLLKKNQSQQEEIIMATPEEMGHDHQGRALYHPGTNDIWDDLATVLSELDTPAEKSNQHVFSVKWSNINPDILIPRFYRGLMNPPKMPNGCYGIRLGDLVEDGTLKAWDGHGSPEAQAKGRGDIPYIRVSDIVNWEMYRNPVTGIPRDVYERLIGDKSRPKEGDVIFVRRGSYRIGTVAMASPRDSQVLLTRELLTLRVVNLENRCGITPFYLIAVLSSKTVQDQIKSYVFVDTTLPNINDRWKYLLLPIHEDLKDIERISAMAEESIRKKWSAQEKINTLARDLGKIVT